jgi:hypothetical protein
MKRDICAAVLVVAALFLSACQSEQQPEVLSADEACELLIDRSIQDAIGLWSMRYSVIVSCKDGEISALIATAHSQQTVPRGVTDAPQEMKKIASAAIGRVLERRNWTTRYPKISVQYFP